MEFPPVSAPLWVGCLGPGRKVLARYGGTCHCSHDLNPKKDVIISSVRQDSWETQLKTPLLDVGGSEQR